VELRQARELLLTAAGREYLVELAADWVRLFDAKNGSWCDDSPSPPEP